MISYNPAPADVDPSDFESYEDASYFPDAHEYRTDSDDEPLDTPTEEPAPASKAGKATYSTFMKVNDPDGRVAQAAAEGLDAAGMAERMHIYYADRAMFAHGVWYIWTGQYWAEDRAKLHVQKLAIAVILSVKGAETDWIASLAKEVQAAAKNLQEAIEDGDGRKEIKAHEASLEKARAKAAGPRIRWANQALQSTSMVKSTIAFAETTMASADKMDRFDRNPELVTFMNGTLDLRTLTLRPHEPADFITKLIPHDYRPDAACAALDTILAGLDRSDPGNSRLLQWYLGTGLTGYARRMFLTIKGKPGVGKSTLFEAVQEAMGTEDGSGYARPTPLETMTLDANPSGSKAQPALHLLRGKRFVFVDEATRGFVNAELVKKLSAGGAMETRANFGDPVQWKSRMSIVMAGNDWLALPTEDSALRDRLIAIQLTHEIDKSEHDPQLEADLKSPAGYEAILAWAAHGAHDWLAAGGTYTALPITEKMEAAKAEYFSEMDPLAGFWETEVAVIAEDEDAADCWMQLTTSQWYELYVAHCRRQGTKPKIPTERKFGQALTERGVPAGNPTTVTVLNVRNSGRMRRGIRHRTFSAEILSREVSGMSVACAAGQFPGETAMYNSADRLAIRGAKRQAA